MTLELEDVLLVAVVGALLLLTGLAIGLWIGELGRRKDAQRREGVLKVDPIEPATVIPPGGGAPDGSSRELSDPPESWILETMEEVGCSREEAELEWRTLVSKSLGDGGAGQGWMQE